VTTTGIKSPHHNTGEAQVLSSFSSQLSEPGLKPPYQGWSPLGLSRASSKPSPKALRPHLPKNLDQYSRTPWYLINTHHLDQYSTSRKDDLKSLHNYQVQAPGIKSNPTTPPTRNTPTLLLDFNITTPISGTMASQDGPISHQSYTRKKNHWHRLVD
jgi:hypothetical protein